MQSREKRTSPRAPYPRVRSRRVIITVLDTLAWLAVTATLVAILGNSVVLQIGSTIVFTALWFVAVRIWASRLSAR